MAFLIFICLAFLSQAARADTVTVVLQNGLNGYEGCSDASLVHLVTGPGGSSDTLKTSCG